MSMVRTTVDREARWGHAGSRVISECWLLYIDNAGADHSVPCVLRRMLYNGDPGVSMARTTLDREARWGSTPRAAE